MSNSTGETAVACIHAHSLRVILPNLIAPNDSPSKLMGAIIILSDGESLVRLSGTAQMVTGTFTCIMSQQPLDESELDPVGHECNRLGAQ